MYSSVTLIWFSGLVLLLDVPPFISCPLFFTFSVLTLMLLPPSSVFPLGAVLVPFSAVTMASSEAQAVLFEVVNRGCECFIFFDFVEGLSLSGYEGCIEELLLVDSPTAERYHPWKRGKTNGRLLTITAMKDSRVDHLPDNDGSFSPT